MFSCLIISTIRFQVIPAPGKPPMTTNIVMSISFTPPAIEVDAVFGGHMIIHPGKGRRCVPFGAEPLEPQKQGQIISINANLSQMWKIIIIYGSIVTGDACFKVFHSFQYNTDTQRVVILYPFRMWNSLSILVLDIQGKRFIAGKQSPGMINLNPTLQNPVSTTCAAGTTICSGIKGTTGIGSCSLKTIGERGDLIVGRPVFSIGYNCFGHLYANIPQPEKQILVKGIATVCARIKELIQVVEKAEARFNSSQCPVIFIKLETTV